ncbi:MAG: hypothetical protein AB7U82_07180 [Blastocatellales bacterium]
MNWKLSSVIFVFACLLIAINAIFAQPNARQLNAQVASAQAANTKQSNQIVYTTPPKTAVAKLSSGESKAYEVRGKVTFTLTAANNNDTVAGTLVYTIPDEARQKIARISGKPLNSIPASVVKKDVVAGFQDGAACPVVNIEIGATELDVAGVKLSFNRIVTDIIETPGEVPQHFCAWTRQINVKRQRRGIVASLNRLITEGQ